MFADRKDAALKLAERLKHYKDKQGILVLALPRGGVVTGAEIAAALGAPLDVLIVRKIGFPMQEELAIGGVSETGTVVLNQDIIEEGGVSSKYIDEEVTAQKEEISRRVKLYRDGKPLENLDGGTIILVDDGVATGATMKAAIAALKKEKIRRLVVAVPVSPISTAAELIAAVDEFICLHTPADFFSVGSYYSKFYQVTDDEVMNILRESKTRRR